MSVNTIPNQIFVGCPWHKVRPKYEKVINKLNQKYPLSFVIVGRSEDQKAEDLLEKIKDKLFRSNSAIFDATYGNPNVSLEYGMAEIKGITRVICVSKHKHSSSKSESAIISDLSGKSRNEYKQLGGLKRVLEQYARNHGYTKKFESALRKSSRRLKKGPKRIFRTLALKVIHFLDDKETIRRKQVMDDLKNVGYYKEKQIDNVLKKLQKERLIVCTEGKYSDVYIR